MTVLASDIMDRSAGILNDTARDLYTNAIQLPYLKIANDELQDELTVNGILLQNKVATTAVVAAGATTYGTLPSDLLIPQKCWERPSNQPNEDFIEMTEKEWVPSTPLTSYLQWWIYQNNDIKFLGATQNIDVRLDYVRVLSPFTTAGSTAEVIGSINFLSYMTASLCARHIGMNEEYADKLEIRSYKHLARLTGIGVRNTQSLRLRKRPFRIANGRFR